MKNSCCLTTECVIKREPTIKNIFRSGAIMTGFDDLDDITGGFFPGELICLAGRYSMGSTGLALSILNRVCIKEKKRCFYFSLADGGRNIVSRLAAIVSHNQDIFRPEYEQELKDALKIIKKTPLYINEEAFFVDSIEKACKKLVKKKPIELVIIDHYQLVISRKKGDRSLISARLKRLARRIGCPVIVLCQLDSSIDHRDDHRPLLTDLISPGEMRYYSDKVLLLYREDYYSIDTNDKVMLKAEVLMF